MDAFGWRILASHSALALQVNIHIPEVMGISTIPGLSSCSDRYSRYNVMRTTGKRGLSFNSAGMLPLNTAPLSVFKFILCPKVDVRISAFGDK